MRKVASSIVAVLVVALYIAGLGGIVPASGDCSCGLEGSSLKCYCCAAEGSKVCTDGPAFEGCRGGKKAADLVEAPAIAEPVATVRTAAIGDVKFIDTSARVSAGFDNLPERPPAA